MKIRIITAIGGLLVFAISFFFYYLTASPYVQPGDSTEMVTAAVVLGIPHQPGYPLNTYLGHLAYKSDIAGTSGIFRINLVSALLQSLTVVVFYFLVIELCKYISNEETETDKDKDLRESLNGFTRIVAGFASSLFMAFSLIFWQYATKFEVFPLNNLFAVGIMLLSLRILVNLGKDIKPERSNKESPFKERRHLGVKANFHHPRNSFNFVRLGRLGELGWLGVLGLLLGLAVTHHQTIVLIFPSLTVLIIGNYKKIFLKENWKYLGVLGILGVLGVLGYFGLILTIASNNPPMDTSHVTGIQSALSALFRSEFGAFSAYLRYEKPQIVSYPSDQIIYYFRNLLTDFSIFGIAFMMIGIYFLYKYSRITLTFILTGIIVSGIIFLSYANFPLTDGFNLATVRRFHMLPNIFVSLLLAMGIYFIASTVFKLSEKEKVKSVGVYVVLINLLFSFSVQIYRNYSKASNKENTMTQNFIKNSYGSLPDNSLVLVTGDIQNMTGEYFRLVEKPDSKMMIFTPGRFYLEWYLQDLLSKYPGLSVPVPNNGNKYTTVSQLIEANYGKFPIYISPDLIQRDPEIENKFTLYPRHLLMEARKKGEDIKLEEWKEEQEKLWKDIDPEFLGKFFTGPHFENSFIFNYLRHIYNVGFVYKDVKLYDEAIVEFDKVLQIDPNFVDALVAMSDAYASKDQPDYAKAIEYLQRFQSVVAQYSADQYYAAQNKMIEYDKKYKEDYQRELEKQKEATEEGKLKE